MSKVSYCDVNPEIGTKQKRDWEFASNVEGHLGDHDVQITICNKLWPEKEWSVVSNSYQNGV